ncbi:hypothetical protein O9G_001017 [Rozella allomycis CSF55]|uniref:Uncharacterized protein n=1 Tax=Rozella allomycis (strain CSF55) TaxID=988480 RepID=A0A075AMZ9_ROZAC|nr:hypothetical protein O9G_001017 [Rozella allomycis CSF55]|eukprot:EPZ31106.1 hypothetical protein O9G_001017 [Rozella allomycis CSF55]
MLSSLMGEVVISIGESTDTLSMGDLTGISIEDSLDSLIGETLFTGDTVVSLMVGLMDSLRGDSLAKSTTCLAGDFETSMTGESLTSLTGDSSCCSCLENSMSCLGDSISCLKDSMSCLGDSITSSLIVSLLYLFSILKFALKGIGETIDSFNDFDSSTILKSNLRF